MGNKSRKQKPQQSLEIQDQSSSTPPQEIMDVPIQNEGSPYNEPRIPFGTPFQIIDRHKRKIRKVIDRHCVEVDDSFNSFVCRCWGYQTYVEWFQIDYKGSDEESFVVCFDDLPIDVVEKYSIGGEKLGEMYNCQRNRFVEIGKGVLITDEFQHFRKIDERKQRILYQSIQSAKTREKFYPRAIQKYGKNFIIKSKKMEFVIQNIHNFQEWTVQIGRKREYSYIEEEVANLEVFKQKQKYLVALIKDVEDMNIYGVQFMTLSGDQLYYTLKDEYFINYQVLDIHQTSEDKFLCLLIDQPQCMSSYIGFIDRTNQQHWVYTPPSQIQGPLYFDRVKKRLNSKNLTLPISLILKQTEKIKILETQQQIQEFRSKVEKEIALPRRMRHIII